LCCYALNGWFGLGKNRGGGWVKNLSGKKDMMLKEKNPYSLRARGLKWGVGYPPTNGNGVWTGGEKIFRQEIQRNGKEQLTSIGSVIVVAERGG